MTELNPLAVFEDYAQLIELTAASVAETAAAEDAAQKALTAAADAHSGATNRQQIVERAAVQALYETITPDTNPVEHLVALASLANNGQLVSYGGALHRLRASMLTEPQPIAIVSTRTSAVAFGRTSGDMRVRQPDISERSYRHPFKINFELPLVEVHRIGVNPRFTIDTYFDDFDTEPIIYGNVGEDPFMAAVYQSLENVIVADSGRRVRAAIKDLKKGNGQSTTSNEAPYYRRSVEVAGMPPLIAYGYHAVAAVLQSVRRKAEKNEDSKLDPADIAATAINIGIDPADIAPSVSKTRAGLEATFARGIATLINSQVGVEINGTLGSSESFKLGSRPPSTTIKVMRYLKAEDRVAMWARDALSPLFADATATSQAGLNRATGRVASSLGELFNIVISPDELTPIEADGAAATTRTKVYL